MEWLPHGDLLQHIRRVALQRQREYAATLLSAEEREAVEVRRLAPKPIPATAAALRCLGFRDIQLITAQLVLALARTAERGLVLRDLKPENIAFDDKYRACLIDFDTVDMEGALVKPETNHGVALPPEVGHREETRRSDPCAMNGEAPAGARAKRRVTVSEIQAMRKKTASFCGTAQYVSPEMVGECKWSYSSDLWALGAIVYEMVYGAHMFSGLSTFEVLQKVVQGATKGGAALADTLVPFPLVHLDGGGDSSNAEDYWSRTKDFILRLVAIDPRARLGVHREHGTFDLDQLRRHPFFEDFTLWGLLEEQVAGFRPRHIPLENEGASAAHAAEEDRTPSLLEHYNIAPFNDPQYADYVFRATADTNPFEQFLRNEFEDATGEEGLEGLDAVDQAERNTGPTSTEQPPPVAAAEAVVRTSEEKDVGAAAPTADATPISEAPPTSAADSTANAQWVFDEKAVDDDASTSSAEVEIIDDVGMHYSYGPVHPDFQK
ncbi:protein kinase [Strigomonas culicis]|uniref:non-specific serine/threonine protein kinase n=1 Tax=Strigomonas culicis TaxID=28005 RepID=S9UAA9_9TRYP|nr:protein kinase [Strigomonas culicis]|eukprot:EPY25669.1 protein kinase [Strigomonas culicis]